MVAQPTSSPWRTIWNKPRQTIRDIVAKNPSQQLLALSGIYGFPVLIHVSQFLSLGDVWPAWLVVLVMLILSPVAGIIGISIWSILVKWTGGWIGGKADYKEVRASVAWSNVPGLVNVILWLFLALMLGSSLFVPDASSELSVGVARIVTLIFSIQLIFSIWAFVLFVITLSEVQKFSALRSIGNILMPCVILIVLGWILNSIMLGMQG